ncbi:DnaD domain protein [Bacillus haikouensis]|uniref:DnaD domain-containing protein n=1 Tax=Bacillus haikouensis TaxID=1510468 RepID=UPI001553862E|nr:DnaD domain protein [Bacillus haikouensis]NQD66488.1 DnaD domain protein [Bacillus haikouensis]
MNYLKELKAFKDWLLLNDLNTSAIALWHTLMAINNMAGWKERFNAPNSTVEKLTGLSKQGLVNARIKLIENELIEYEKGKKGKAPIYKVKSLVNSVDQSLYQSDTQSLYQSGYQSDDQQLTIPKHKLNKTKLKEDVGEEARVSPNPFQFYEQEGFGVLGGYIPQKIVGWCGDLSESLVLEAMKIAVEQGTKKWGYVEAILKNWSQKGIKTVEQCQAEQKQYKEQRSQRSPNKAGGKVRPIRKEMLPDWFEDGKSSEDSPSGGSDDYDFEKEKEKLQAELLAYRRG